MANLAGGKLSSANLMPRRTAKVELSLAGTIRSGRELRVGFLAIGGGRTIGMAQVQLPRGLQYNRPRFKGSAAFFPPRGRQFPVEPG
jgi:hypothetical protein